MFRNKQSVVEKDEYVVETPYNQHRGLVNMDTRLDVIALSFVCGLGITIVIVGGLVYLAHLFPIITYTFVGTIATLPLLGVGYLGVKLWKYIRSVQVIEIADKGNIIRLPNGNTQVISTEDVYAFETKDALQPKAIELPRIVNEVSGYNNQLDVPYYKSPFPPVFPEGNDYPTVSTVETAPETLVETVLDNLQQEQEQAKQVLASRERDVVKEHIRILHEKRLPLRSISAIVRMQGRRYGEFKEICKELGINTE